MSYLSFKAARPALVAAAILGALCAPWWVPALAIALLCLRWRAWEAPLIGLWIDLLWLPASPFSSVPLFTVGALAAAWVLEPLRRRFLLP